jgi:uncharacterized paraquat-inducible protein A
MAAITCPNCKHHFRLPDNHTGAKIACPRCEHVLVIKARQAGPQDVVATKPVARQPRPPTEEEEEEDLVVPEVDEDAPAPPKRKGFKPCPRCGAEDPKRVLFTFWGSFYGPALFNHVRCRKCKYAYNGRTGGSNLIWAIIFVSIPTLIIAGLLGFIAFVLYKAMF